MKIDAEAKTITILEGQFSDNELNGVGRRIIINYKEKEIKSEQMVGNWAKGAENGYMNHVGENATVANQMYSEGKV